MLPIIQSSPLIHAIGWTLLHSLWQISLVGIALWVILNFMIKKSSKNIYNWSVFALLVISIYTVFTFVYSLDFKLSNNQIATEQTLDIPKNNIDSSSPLPLETFAIEKDKQPIVKNMNFELETILPYLVVGWMLGILLFGIRFSMSWWNIRYLRQTKMPLPNSISSWQNQVDIFCKKMGIKKKVEVSLSPHITSPITFSHFKPIILFPINMVTGLTPTQIEMLLLHELAHIKRSDFFINIIQSFIEVVFFYHPFVWWISKQIRTTREHCCDDIAIEICKDHYTYAETLTQLQSSFFSPKKSLAMSAKNNMSSFTYRIKRLFQNPVSQPSISKSFFSVSLISCFILLLAFQSPFLEKVNSEFKNEGVFYMITKKKIRFQLAKVRNELRKYNIKLETQIDDKPSGIQDLHGKIIMPDGSHFQFYIQELNYIGIALDFSKEKPFSFFLSGIRANYSSEKGRNNSYLAEVQRQFGTTRDCNLGNISIVNRFLSQRLRIQNMPNKNVIYFFDGKEISESKIHGENILDHDIFSIKKTISKESDANEIYHITSLNHELHNFRNKLNECERKIIWGDSIFINKYTSINISVADFLKLKNQPIKIDQCGEIHELATFSISSQKNDNFMFLSQNVENYQKKEWVEKVNKFLDKPPYNQLLTFDQGYTTIGTSVYPFIIKVGNSKPSERKRFFLNENGKLVMPDYGTRLYDTRSIYFHSSPNPMWENYAYYLNDEKLERGHSLKPPHELRSLNKIDSMIFLAGKSLTDAYPDAKKDSIWLVYSDTYKKK